MLHPTGYLDSGHDRALNAVGGGRKVRDYHYTFNGFAAEITPDQAKALQSVPGVTAVTKDELRTMDRSSTPTFLGLTAPGGLWDQLGGFDRAWEDIIIGDVDSGIWPESLSFSDRTGLLLRDLLDHFGGDIEKAVGAYNGGIGNPNPQYAAGVQQVAQYARKILEQVAARNAATIASARFVSVARSRPKSAPPR